MPCCHNVVEHGILLEVRPSGYTAVWDSSRTFRSRKLFVTTKTELNAAREVGLTVSATAITPSG